ncbi:uncharacterized protein [Solanum lycopersicum]|uniref:uncharacterized protein n=1 Tax=Solanum lycopersicum TaxID=4081 RepID=UPI000532D343
MLLSHAHPFLNISDSSPTPTHPQPTPDRCCSLDHQQQVVPPSPITTLPRSVAAGGRINSNTWMAGVEANSELYFRFRFSSSKSRLDRFSISTSAESELWSEASVSATSARPQLALSSPSALASLQHIRFLREQFILARVGFSHHDMMFLDFRHKPFISLILVSLVHLGLAFEY